MLSQQCQERNKTIIPKLLDDHGALLYGNKTLIDLSTAENKLLMPKLLSQMKTSLSTLEWADTDLAYSEGVGGCPGVRQQIADLANDHFEPFQKVDKSHIVLGAGGCYALSALVSEICDPGDAILIAAPYWPGLDLAISVRNRAKVITVQVPFDEFYDAKGIQYYSKAIEAATCPIKAILICNPHNPLGGNYPRETLQEMLNLCTERRLHLISDEVYALSQHVNPTTNFVSALSLDTTGAAGLVHVLYSLSKDFACNGVRMGAFISQTNREVVMSGALSTFCQTSSMSTKISAEIILSKDNVDYVISTGRGLLTDAYGTIKSFFDTHRIEYMPAETGMYVFAKLCPANDLESEAVFKSILKKNSLVISSGTDYHLDSPGWYRICYGCEPEKLAVGLQRIHESVEEFKSKSKSILDVQNLSLS